MTCSHYIPLSVLYPPAIMAGCGLVFMWLVFVPNRPLPRWRYRLGVAVLLSGQAWFFGNIIYAVWIR